LPLTANGVYIFDPSLKHSGQTDHIVYLRHHAEDKSAFGVTFQGNVFMKNWAANATNMHHRLIDEFYTDDREQVINMKHSERGGIEVCFVTMSWCRVSHCHV